jgi:hypothetical protein
MSRPTDRQIRDLFATIRALATPTGKPPRSKLDDLERRLLEALNRDTAGTTQRDGYPARTIPTGTGQSPVPIDANNPDAGSVVLTSVEAAALGTSEADQHREDTWQATSFLVEAVGAIGAMQRRLDLIDQRSTPTRTADTAGTGSCQACTQWCSGTGEDRLRSGYCNACRVAWDRAGRPDRATFNRTRRVPTETAGP